MNYYYLNQTGEQGLGIADALVSSGAVDIVIVDSACVSSTPKSMATWDNHT